MYFSLDAAHTSGGHGWPASTTLLKKNSESQPWTLDGRAPPADITTHRLRVAPSMAFFLGISGGRGRLSLPLPADILFKNAIDGAMRNRWVVRGGRASVRVHGCDSEFFFRSVVDAGQPWPDVCAASREKYTHASCSSNTTYSTSGHGKGSFQFQVCPSTESQETFGN